MPTTFLKSAAVASFFALTFAASTSFAQGVDYFGPYGGLQQGDTPRESRQEAALELRFGPYRPNVDDEFDGATPFNDVFGNGNRYLLGIEVDWQALRIPYLGTFGPGISIGYTRFSGKGFTESGERAQEDSKLTLVPMYLVGVLRADVIARETPVPLVPYAKLGLGAGAWWTSSGGESSRVEDSKGSDVSYGYQFALGGMLLLDAIEPTAAVELDSSMGINNTYFFMEWYVSNLNGFGSGDQMQVGTNTWFLGLAFEI